MPKKLREETIGLKGKIILHVAGRNEDEAINKMPSATQMIQEMQRAVFCPTPPAENAAAGTKRLFDVILAGCLPVVISFETVWGNGVSWFRRDGACLSHGRSIGDGWLSRCLQVLLA